MHSIGIDIGATYITAGVVTDDNVILSKASAKTKVPASHRDLRSQILDVAKTAMRDARRQWKDLTSIGIGVPGVVDTEKGVVSFSHALFVEDFKVKEMIEQIVECPVYVDNDANCSAYGELMEGSLKGCKNGLALVLDENVGCAVVVNGEIYYGSHKTAGELAHMVVEMTNGRYCTCGRTGCWNKYASATGLVQTAREYIISHPDMNSQMLTMIGGNINNITVKTPFEGKREGYHLAPQIVDIYVKHIGVGVVNAINMFDPDVISIGGEVAKVGDNLLDLLKDYVNRMQVNSKHKDNKIVMSKLGDDAAILGAANLHSKYQ